MTGLLDNDLVPALGDEWKGNVHAMLLHLNALCDGAHDRDDQGFNGQDAAWGKAMARRPMSMFTDDDWVNAYAMLRKYARTQLGPAGFDYHMLQQPGARDTERRTVQNVRDITVVDGQFMLSFGYSPDVVQAVKALPERRYDPKFPGWLVPFHLAAEVRELAGEWGFTMSPDAIDVVPGSAPAPQPAGGEIDLDGDDLVIQVPYRADIVAAIKSLPNREFDGESKAWRVPTYLIRPVRAIAERFGITLTMAAAMLPDFDPDKIPVSVSAEGDVLRIRFPYNRKLTAVMHTVESRWDGQQRCWMVPVEHAPDLVARLSNAGAALGEAAGEIVDAAQQVLARIQQSRALDAQVDIPTLGLELYPFQRAGVAYALDARRPGDGRIGCIVADEMGLGKTPEGLAILEAAGVYPACAVVPNTIKHKWVREANRWIPNRRILRIERGVPPKLAKQAAALLESHPHRYVADAEQVAAVEADDLLSMLEGDEADPFFGRMQAMVDLRDPKHLSRTLNLLRWADLIVMNHESTASWSPILAALGLKGFVADESHMLKDPSALRTKAAQEIADSVGADGAVICLTGTPVLNRREEIISQLEVIGRRSEFGEPKDIKADGNIARRMRSKCFVRRLKAEVLPELPARQYEPVEMEGDPAAMAVYKKAQTDFFNYLREWAMEKATSLGIEDPGSWAMEKAVKASAAEQLVQIMHLRRLAAKAKLPEVKRWVADFYDQGGEKLLTFAHHRDVLEDLAHSFDAPLIYGDTSTDERDRLVQQFMDDPSFRTVVVGINVGGVGLEFTSASNVLFVEHPWSPMIQDQCLDRCYGRMNDVHGAVGWDSLCLDTIDFDMIELLASKRIECENTTDGDEYGNDEDSKTSVLADLVWNLTQKAVS